MPSTQENENVTQNFIRAFTQRGGPGPTNIIRYAGADEQYLMIGDISNPIRGGINAINVNDPMRRGVFKRVGATFDAPDIPSASVTFKQKFGGPPWYAFDLSCPQNFYESVGLCPDPSDFKNGWQTMKILSRGYAADRTFAGRTPFDGSDESTAEVAFSWLGGSYDIGPINLGEVAAVDVTTEVIDITYDNTSNCANCGPADDGTKHIYALQQTAGGSSADLGKVLWTGNSGATWTASAITGLGVGVLVTAIAVMGSYLIVLVKSENAYYYASLNAQTGAPGAWTKVTTGFVATKTPNAIFVENANRAYIVGDTGYIYLLTDVTAGVSVLSAAGTTSQNLLSIHGNGSTLLATGAVNTSIVSTNRGLTWATTTASVNGTLQTSAVWSDYVWWIGTAAGGVWFTEDAGASWTQLALPAPAIVGVHHIVFATTEVGYIAATRSGPTAVIFGTFDGGKTWSESGTSRFPTAPTYGRPNKIAFPNVPAIGVAAGNIAVAGLSGNLTDGVIYVGATPVL